MSKRSLQPEALARLLECSDYRGFISLLIIERSKVTSFGYADIARNGGFATRSFPHDVVKGRKRLTLRSLPKMIKGLGLNTELGEYFKTLVEIEHDDCRIRILDEIKLRDNLQTLKIRLNQKGVRLPQSDLGFQISTVPMVYAALGYPKEGANLSDISKRLELPEDQIILTLKHLINLNLIQKNGARYFALQNHVTIPGLKDSELFKKHFIYSAEEAIKKSRKNMKSDETLFLSSSFSVHTKDLPKMKEELREVLFRYIDNAEKSDGNKVVSLIAGLF